MEKRVLEIQEEFVTLGQLLKVESVISSGGMAKWYVSEFPIQVNGESENRRGKKLYNGDVVTLPAEQLEVTIVHVTAANEA